MTKQRIYKPFDREAKIVMINALKKGVFEQSDIDILVESGCIDAQPILNVQVIDNGVPLANSENEESLTPYNINKKN